MSYNLEKYGLHVTKNECGYMHPLSSLGSKFIEFSQYVVKKPVVDIGCAYGVATLPCLDAGASVFACDREPKHLKALRKNVSEKNLNNLTTICGVFPNDINFETDTIGAVLLSHVLSFLTKENIETGFSKISKWLGKGGKIFISNYTPYHKTVRAFIPIYEKQALSEKPFCGEMKDKFLYHDSEIIDQSIPKRLMLLDKITIAYLFKKYNFKTELLEYAGGVDSGVPKPFCLDGREWVNAIGTKE